MSRPRGRFVVFVGPDGVGKTSVAAELQQRCGSRYFHFRPKLCRTWSTPEPGSIVEKRPYPSGTVESMLRLMVSFARFWLGYQLRIRPELASGRHVLADRWAYGYLAKPQELKYLGPASLAGLMLSLLPEPDAVVCLVAPPATIHARKPELTIDEIIRDSKNWRRIPAANLVELEAIDDPGEIAVRIADWLELC